MNIKFFKATTPEERAAIDLFFTRHNRRGFGSTKGYRAYYAAVWPPDGRELVDRLVAAAKVCPLHTEAAARFYGKDDFAHVYCLQRLGANHPPKYLLSKFWGWVLKQEGKNSKVHYIATYASTGDYDEREEDVQKQKPHSGGIYKATNAVYCGKTQGGHVEAYTLDGVRHSRRRGPKTIRVRDIPLGALIHRAAPMHRFCWAVGPPLRRMARHIELARRMEKYKYDRGYQLRLLFKLGDLWNRILCFKFSTST